MRLMTAWTRCTRGDHGETSDVVSGIMYLRVGAVRHRRVHARRRRPERRALDRAGLRSLQRLRQAVGAFGIAVLGALLVAGRSPVSLHVAFVATAGCYAAAIALAVTGHR